MVENFICIQIHFQWITNKSIIFFLNLVEEKIVISHFLLVESRV